MTPTFKPGRPNTGPGLGSTRRLVVDSPELLEQIANLASKLKMSKAALVRQALAFAFEHLDKEP